MIIVFTIIFLIILLALAALTAACEISIIGASRIKLKRLAAEGSKSAKVVLSILGSPQKFFGTILVANNTMGALIAVIVTAMLIHIFGGDDNWVVIMATLIAAFLIIVSEVTAKTIAAKRADRLSLLMAGSIRRLMTVFAPIVKVLEFITDILVTAISGKSETKTSLVTEEEIKSMIRIGGEEGVLHKEKYKMLSRVFDFGDTLVKNVITPKKDMMSINIASGIDDIIYKALESGYSRIPVHKDTPDNIVGIINMKDLLNLCQNKDLVVLQDIIYPATIIPDSKKVTDLLKEFQNGHTHLAIVVDSQGKVEGLVTLEDLLEEIVGEIEDEHDLRSKPPKPLSPPAPPKL